MVAGNAREEERIIASGTGLFSACENGYCLNFADIFACLKWHGNGMSLPYIEIVIS